MKRRSRQLRLSEDVARAQEIIDLLVPTLIKAGNAYVDLDLDGSELTDSEVTKVSEQLMAITLCLRDIHGDYDLVDYLAADGRRTGRDADLRPTISLLRMMQRSFGLVMSDDPDQRQLAMPVEEFNSAFQPVSRFWIGL